MLTHSVCVYACAVMPPGVCLVATGHPLDLIKVNIQTMEKPAPGQPPMYTGMVDCARKLVAKDGVRCA